MAEAESPTRDEQEAYLRERALGPVVANAAIAPFWLIPFTLLVSVLTKHENDLARLQWWVGSAVLSTIVIAVGVATYRHRGGDGSDTAMGRSSPASRHGVDGIGLRHDDVGGQFGIHRDGDAVRRLPHDCQRTRRDAHRRAPRHVRQPAGADRRDLGVHPGDLAELPDAGPGLAVGVLFGDADRHPLDVEQDGSHRDPAAEDDAKTCSPRSSSTRSN